MPVLDPAPPFSDSFPTLARLDCGCLTLHSVRVATTARIHRFFSGLATEHSMSPVPLPSAPAAADGCHRGDEAPSSYADIVTDSLPVETKQVEDGRLSGAFWPIRSVRAYRGDVWHYTDAAGLEGIVSSGELRASSTVLLNDPQELRYGAKRISRWWAANRDRITADASGLRPIVNNQLESFHKTILENPAYVVCASERRLLSQWRNYASSKGFAIKLDASRSYGIVDDPLVGGPKDAPRTTSTPKNALTLLPTWVRVAYKQGEQDEVIGATFKWLAMKVGPVGRLLAANDDLNATTLVKAYVAALAASMKHPAYREEREVRLIAYLPENRRPGHHPAARGVVPFIRIMATPDPDLSEQRPFQPLPIREVRVGPPQGVSERQRRLGAESLLRTYGFGAEVKGSQIPFIP